MGFSCTKKADDVLQAWQDRCREETGMTNVYLAFGERYHFEVSRRDQPDGGIAGEVLLSVGEHTCRPVGAFRIDGEGVVQNGPAVLRMIGRRVNREQRLTEERDQKNAMILGLDKVIEDMEDSL